MSCCRRRSKIVYDIEKTIFIQEASVNVAKDGAKAEHIPMKDIQATTAVSVSSQARKRR
jgi:hypothetical protein